MERPDTLIHIGEVHMQMLHSLSFIVEAGEAHILNIKGRTFVFFSFGGI